MKKRSQQHAALCAAFYDKKHMHTKMYEKVRSRMHASHSHKTPPLEGGDVDYRNGKIYRISSEKGRNFYIGSTAEDLDRRLQRHTSYMQTHRTGRFHRLSSEDVCKHGDAVITLLAKVPCTSKQELEDVEARWHTKYAKDPHCVNQKHLRPSKKKLRGGGLGEDMGVALSGDQIQAVAGGGLQVLRYPDLEDFGTWDDFMAKGPAAVLFLIESETSGHWLAAFNNAEGANIFDPMGVSIDAERSYISKGTQAELDETTPQFARLLQGHPRPIVSHVDFQKQSPSINTCGRWSGLRLSKRDMSHTDFNAWVQQQVTASGLSPDAWVTSYTDSVV